MGAGGFFKRLIKGLLHLNLHIRAQVIGKAPGVGSVIGLALGDRIEIAGAAVSGIRKFDVIGDPAVIAPGNLIGLSGIELDPGI